MQGHNPVPISRPNLWENDSFYFLLLECSLWEMIVTMQYFYHDTALIEEAQVEHMERIYRESWLAISIMWRRTEDPIEHIWGPAIRLQSSHPAISSHWNHHSWGGTGHHRAKNEPFLLCPSLREIHNDREHNELVAGLLH